MRPSSSKDMSRLGRDYLKVGQVMEILRQRGVRLIAINDGVDSLKGDDDFTPFRNIMNEFYARDTSRKIRSVFKSKGNERQAPDRHRYLRLLVGREAGNTGLWTKKPAEVVRRIFSLTMEGYGPYQIARLAVRGKGRNARRPPGPLWRGSEQDEDRCGDPYGWGASTVVEHPEKAGVPGPHGQFQDPQALQGQEKPLCGRKRVDDFREHPRGHHRPGNL